MDELWISIGSLVVGIVVTVLVTRYYYRRSVNKSLTPYVQFASSPFKSVDPQVRKELEIKYQGRAVDNLYEIQFLIANTGERAIGDVIEPLSLRIPESCTLLDASILHIHPDGRKVQLETSPQRDVIRFRFSLLNGGDFFIVKLLINGTPCVKDFDFEIVGDDLPPTLSPAHLPYDAIATSKKREFEFSLLTIGLIITLFGVSVSKLIYDSWLSLPSFGDLGVWGFISILTPGDWASFISIIPALLLLVIGVLMTVLSFTEGSFPPPKRKFIVPADKQFLKRRQFRIRGEFVDSE